MRPCKASLTLSRRVSGVSVLSYGIGLPTYVRNLTGNPPKIGAMGRRVLSYKKCINFGKKIAVLKLYKLVMSGSENVRFI